MNKFKNFRVPICLALLGIGILVLGAWDMQRVTAAPVPESWSQGADLPLPDAFYGSAQCQGDPDGFYVVAGWKAWFDSRDEVWHYDAAIADWKQLAPYPEEMGLVSVVCYQSLLYGAGGNLEGLGTSDHFYRYDIDADTWTQLANLPRSQNGAALAAWDGYLYMIGGDDAPVVPVSPTTQVDRYDIQAGTWELDWGTPMPDTPFGSWLQAGRYVYLVGGYTSAYPINSDATLRYDLVTNTWESGPSFASRRALADIVITSQYLYAIGGDANGGGSGDETNLVERLDLSLWPGGEWVDTGDPLPEPRMASQGFCSEAMAGGEIWSVGGLDSLDDPTAETYYRPSEPCYDWPPQRLGVHPSSNSHDAEVTTLISITYDQDMDTATVNPQTFAVHARQTGWLTETLSVDGGMVKLQPVDALHAGELVQVSATTGTLSMGGEAPLEPTVWQFTTAPWGGNAFFHDNQSLASDGNRNVALGDLDGDVDLDAIGVSCNGVTHVYFNDGNGMFTEVQSFDHASYCLLDADVGDLDGDGDLDAFLTDYDTPGSHFILFNDGRGDFAITEAFPAHSEGSTELGDLDGDGDLDILTASGGWDPGTLHVWKNDGAGNFTLASDFGTAFERTGLALGDLDGDSDLDIFNTGWNNTYTEVWMNDGSGTFTLAQAIPNANTYIPLLGDLDGDGNLDVYLANTTFALTDLPDEVWLNDGTGYFTNSGQILNTPLALIPALGDLDADGDLDVYLSGWDYAPDEVWLNDGAGNFSKGHSMDEYYDGAFAWLGDLDDDGNLDAFTGNGYTNYYIFLNGDWTQEKPLLEPLGANLVQCVDDPDSFYMVGGILTGNVTTDQLSRYDIANPGQWLDLAPMPAPRRAVAAACYQGKIYVAGGVDYLIYDDFYIYDILSDAWTSGPSLPDPVWGAAMGAWDGKLYLVGGTRIGYPYTPESRVDVYDITSGVWTVAGGQDMLTAASFFGNAQTGSYLYAVGGYSGEFSHNVDQTQRYNMATDEWELGPQFISARALGALAASSSHLYMLGGDMDGGTEFNATDLVEQLDLSTWPNGNWTDFIDPLPAPNLYPATACSEAITGGEIWAVGGVDAAFNPSDTNYYHPIGEPCVSFGVDLPDSREGEGAAGETITYTLSITNTGVVTDYYTLEVTTTWNIELPPGGPGPIGPGESIEIEIAVDVPPDAVWGNQGVTEITAVSISNPAASDTTTITTTSTTVWTRILMPLVMKN